MGERAGGLGEGGGSFLAWLRGLAAGWVSVGPMGMGILVCGFIGF